jgi:hypothetical protein
MIAMRSNIAYLAEPMVSVRIHGESLTTQYSKDHARLCIGDELGVLRDVGNQAKLTGLPALSRACDAAFVRRAVRLLATEPGDETPGMTETDFKTILQDRVASPEERQEMKALVYASLGDEQYWSGKREEAAKSYSLATEAKSGNLKTRAKSFLLRAGAMGSRIRHKLDWPYESVAARYRSDCALLRTGKLTRIPTSTKAG